MVSITEFIFMLMTRIMMFYILGCIIAIVTGVVIYYIVSFCIMQSRKRFHMEDLNCFPKNRKEEEE